MPIRSKGTLFGLIYKITKDCYHFTAKFLWLLYATKDGLGVLSATVKVRPVPVMIYEDRP